MIDELEFCRLDRRRCAIVEAARTLFIKQGYERTTLGHIVECAGGSLATVYKLFGNKDGLLDAVVFEKAASGEALIRDAASCGLNPADTLHRIAEGLHAHFLEPDGVALLRIVIARSIEDADFARRFFERTATRTRHALERLFAAWQANGVAMNGSPEFLAEILLGLLVSDLQTEAISHGVGAQLSSQRLRERTDFFCIGAGLEAARSSAPEAQR